MRIFLLLLFFINVSYATPLRVALSAKPTNLDPFFSTDGNSQNINRLVHLSLTDFNANMEFECRFCESYKEEVIDGRHLITFELKKGVKFWNGQEVTAEDVENSIKYFAHNAHINSIFRFAFRKIEKVQVLGKYKVKLIYPKFDLENLSNLSLLKIIKYNKAPGHHINNIIGAGPYRISKVRPLELTLEPVFNKALPEFVFKIVKDETTLALKLINGEIDLSLASISPRKLAWLKRAKNNLSFFEIASSNYKYLSINHSRDHLKNKKIRQALSLLIPREDILKYKLKGQAVLASGLFSKAFSNLYGKNTIDKFSPVKAKTLIESEGYRKNSDGFYQKDGKVLLIDWKINNHLATIEVVNIIKSIFEQNGILVKLTSQEWGTFMRNFKMGNYDIVLGQWMGFTGADMLKFVFHSESIPPKGGNRGRYINTQMDQLLSMAQVEQRAKPRNDLYKKAQTLANQDYSYINLWHPKISWIGRKCLGDLGPLPNGSFLPLLNIKNECSP
jgi:peptide/nickel transport system substrate-binding protein